MGAARRDTAAGTGRGLPRWGWGAAALACCAAVARAAAADGADRGGVGLAAALAPPLPWRDGAGAAAAAMRARAAAGDECAAAGAGAARFACGLQRRMLERAGAEGWSARSRHWARALAVGGEHVEDLEEETNARECTAAHAAAADGDVELLEALAAGGGAAALNGRSGDAAGYAPAHLAALAGDAAVLGVLRRAGASLVEEAGEGRMLPLHYAAISGDGAAVALLCEEHRRLGLGLGGGRAAAATATPTPLALAVRMGGAGAVAALVEAGAAAGGGDLDTSHDSDDAAATLLHDAAMAGDGGAALAALLAAPAAADRRNDLNSNGLSPAMVLAELMMDEADIEPPLMALSEAGCFGPAAVLDGGERTVYVPALAVGHPRCTPVLLRHMLESICEPDDHLAAAVGATLREVVQLPARRGTTYIDMLAEEYLPRAAELDLDLDEEDHKATTALAYAAWYDNTYAIDALLTAGADVNYRSSGNLTAVLVAADRGNLISFQLLRERGAIGKNAVLSGKDHHGEEQLSVIPLDVLAKQKYIDKARELMTTKAIQELAQKQPGLTDEQLAMAGDAFEFNVDLPDGWLESDEEGRDDLELVPRITPP